MAAPVLKWYETDGTTAAGVDTYTPTAGTPTAAQTTRIYNDNGGAASADDATELRITAVSRDVGGTNFTAEHALSAGAYIECRAVGSGGTGVAAQTTEWTPVGKGRYLYLRDLPSDCYRTIETRINAPAGYGTADVEVLLRAVAAAPAVIIEDGHHESGAVGVCRGIGDGRFGGLLENGNLTEAGTPDNTVEYDVTSWISAGVPYTLAPGAVTLSNSDGAASTLASGESYFAALTLGAGTITTTKGLKGTSPLAVSARPIPPSGEPLLGFVEVPFSAVITNAEINQDDRVYTWFKATTSGASLVVSISGGWAIIDNRLVIITGSTSVTVTASDDTFVYLNPSGTMTANTTGIRPNDRSLLLYVFTADGSGVTATKERRKFTGNREHVIEFSKEGTLAATNAVFSSWPFPCVGYILPMFGAVLALGSTGTTSGATTVDLETSDAGGSFTTVFTDQTYRSAVAYNASNPVSAAGRPQVYRIEPFSRLKAIVDAIPGGASSDLSFSVVVIEADS